MTEIKFVGLDDDLECYLVPQKVFHKCMGGCLTDSVIYISMTNQRDGPVLMTPTSFSMSWYFMHGIS